MEEQFLGIDLGTTSLKTSLIDRKNRILYEKEKPHNAEWPSSNNGWNEQCPKQIFLTLQRLLEDIDFTELRGIGISGQMHGIVLWANHSITSIENFNCSKLITWLDTRCDQQFLAKLPKWMDKNHQEKNISSGFGMATLAWLKQNNELNPLWDRAGTIMDFLAAFITQNEGKVLISTQNAESWGYAEADGWTIQEHDRMFPLSILPHIVQPGQILGKVTVTFAGLPLNVPVLVPLGDLQASLLPVLHSHEAGIFPLSINLLMNKQFYRPRQISAINIGTSAQLALMCSDSNISITLPSLTEVPYFDGASLLVAASLNGGNVFQCLIQQIANWSHQLFGYPEGKQPVKADTSAFLEHLFQDESNSASVSALSIRPNFYAERHTPEMGANIEGWQANTSLENFLCSMARGIIQNLAQMMPSHVISAQNVSLLKLIGRASQQVFAEEARRQFPGMKVEKWEGKTSAAFGAAMHARQIMQKINN